MCGIVGYVGHREALPFLLQGLARVEYRGYDSAGIAVLDTEAPLQLVKAQGRISALHEALADKTVKGSTGIAHTRWATHGVPSVANAHPHVDCDQKIALVHNGIIENYRPLREKLLALGHVFVSETDTEVLAHLIEEAWKEAEGDLEKALRLALIQVHGTYGVAVIHRDAPGVIAAARMGSPLVIGFGEREYWVASDPAAIIDETRRMVFLEDGEYATLTADGRCDISSGGLRVEKTIEEIAWMGEEVQKNGHAHFMLKEMLEQPETVESTLRGRIDLKNGRAVLGGLRDVAERLKKIDRLIIVGCGSAYYAGLVGQYMLEEQVRIPVQIELASEFRYRASVIPPNTAVLAISQSGETADTLAAIREAKRCGALTLGIVNVVGSAIARETDAGVYTHAGPEIGVASTKAFLSQMTVLALLTAFLGRERETMTQEAIDIWLRELASLPSSIRTILDHREHIEREARKYANAPGMFYIGRKYQTPIAHEGALKLKEISYIHAEGYAAGEMKHGPIALAEPSFPCVALCPKDSVYEKTLSNMQELQARGAPLIAITTEGADVAHLAQTIITVPKTIEPLMPLLTVIPVQLFAYAVAVAKGIDPDRPRNLAKSVTVE